eukprot:6191925-Pleurochrysis_carterae.AAC.3
MELVLTHYLWNSTGQTSCNSLKDEFRTLTSRLARVPRSNRPRAVQHSRDETVLLKARTPELACTLFYLNLYRDTTKATIRDGREAYYCYMIQRSAVGQRARARGLWRACALAPVGGRGQAMTALRAHDDQKLGSEPRSAPKVRMRRRFEWETMHLALNSGKQRQLCVLYCTICSKKVFVGPDSHIYNHLFSNIAIPPIALWIITLNEGSRVTEYYIY